MVSELTFAFQRSPLKESFFPCFTPRRDILRGATGGSLTRCPGLNRRVVRRKVLPTARAPELASGTHREDSLRFHVLDLTQRFFLSFSKSQFHVADLYPQLICFAQMLIPFLHIRVIPCTT